MHLTIGWLYGTKMNIYGDRGNVLALAQRARWRGVETEVREIGIGEPIPAESATAKVLPGSGTGMKTARMLSIPSRPRTPVP